MSLCRWRTSRGRHVPDEVLREGMNSEEAVCAGAIISGGYESYASRMCSLPDEQRPQRQVCRGMIASPQAGERAAELCTMVRECGRGKVDSED